jgi:hypothetical protein
MTDDLPEVEQLTILISSTRADLMQYRREASKVIARLAGDFERRLQLVEVSMEKEVQSGERELAVDVSKRWVDESSWVVLIVGWRYGTISPDPKFGGISVTEWEYRYACERGKKVFCFVAGEKDTENRYRVCDTEEIDLKDTIGSESELHRAKLQAFKNSLAPTHLEYFKNLNHFSERLEKTLRSALTLPIDPGSDLAELLLAVRPSIQQCIDRVKIITACKRVHDHLHELRQNVIRPIVESALVQWRAEGRLGIAVAVMIANRAGFSEALVRAIQGETAKMTAKRRPLLDALERVVSGSPQCDFQTGEPVLNEFARTVNRFAGVVQEAFTLADDAMVKDSNVLDDLHVSLLKHISGAKQRRRLSPAEDRALGDQLERAERTKKHLIDVLDAHHSWQQQHDRVDMLNGFRKTQAFDEQLSNYIDNHLPQLTFLLESDTAEPGGPAAPPTTLDRTIAALSASIADLTTNPAVERFESMRKTFDDAFYQIDKRTLGEVERSAQAVRDLENDIEELARKHSEVA